MTSPADKRQRFSEAGDAERELPDNHHSRYFKSGDQLLREKYPGLFKKDSNGGNQRE